MNLVTRIESHVAVHPPQIVPKPAIGRHTRRRAIALAVFAAIGFGIGGLDSARADLVAPAGLAPGTTFRYLYETTTTTSATDPLNATYDAVALTDATSKGYLTYNGAPVTWTALISTTTANANTLISTNDAFYRPDGTEVAATTAALFNAPLPLAAPPVPGTPLLAAIAPSGPDAWTGATSTGGAGSTGSPPTTTVAGNDGGGSKVFVQLGDPTATDGTWLQGPTTDGTSSHPIYAFSSEITVAAVPEPTSLALLAAAAVPLALRRKRRSRQN